MKNDNNPNQLLTGPKTGKSAGYWRSHAARALNVDSNAGDAAILSAFDRHMGFAEAKPRKGAVGKSEVPPPTNYSALFWRRALALACGINPDSGDSAVEIAYGAWMEKLKAQVGSPTPGETPPEMRDKRGLPSSSSEAARRELVSLMVNEKMIRGMSYDSAFQAIRDDNPKLFSKMAQSVPRR